MASSLNHAKATKDDEFYTQLTDIEKELKYYKPHFEGKTVLCNCDDPYESNFFKYFAMNFNQLRLKRLLAVCYDGSPVAGNELLLDFGDEFAETDTQPQRTAYKIEITEVADENGDGAIDLVDVEHLIKNNKNVLTKLRGNGDFRSAESIELLKQADIVCTNPPFSLFREYLAQLVAYDKKFLIIGNQNAITFKEVFPLIKDNKIWLGCGDCVRWFIIPNNSVERITKLNDRGQRIAEGARSRWFTNLDYKERHIDLELYKRFSPEEYPKYANYDAVNVNKTDEIPEDYNGVMGVPITFLDKYNPEQFDLLDCCEPCIDLDILKQDPNFKEYPSRQLVYRGKKCQKTYHRILIRRKQKAYELGAETMQVAAEPKIN